MLVLKRKRRQRVKIGDAIVTVIGWSPNAVRIGIEAPAAVAVVRGELLDQAGDVVVHQDAVERKGTADAIGEQRT